MSRGGVLEFGMYVVVSEKMLVKFAGKGFLGGAGAVVGCVVPEEGLDSGYVAGLRRTCGDSLGLGVLNGSERQHRELTP